MKKKLLPLSLLAVLMSMAPVFLQAQNAQNAPTSICENNSFQCSQNGNEGSIFANTWVSLYGQNMPAPISVVFGYQTGSSSVTPSYSSASQINVCLTIPGVQDNTQAYFELYIPYGVGGTEYLLPPVWFLARTTNPGYAACS